MVVARKSITILPKTQRRLGFAEMDVVEVSGKQVCQTQHCKPHIRCKKTMQETEVRVIAGTMYGMSQQRSTIHKVLDNLTWPG